MDTWLILLLLRLHTVLSSSNFYIYWLLFATFYVFCDFFEKVDNFVTFVKCVQCGTIPMRNKYFNLILKVRHIRSISYQLQCCDQCANTLAISPNYTQKSDHFYLMFRYKFLMFYGHYQHLILCDLPQLLFWKFRYFEMVNGACNDTEILAVKQGKSRKI